VTADGRQLEIGIEAGSGAMKVSLPPGSHEVVLELTDTPVRRFSRYVTLAFAVLVFGLPLLLRPRPAP
jgi:hypothetical protein